MSTVGNWRGPNIVKDSLILYLDASSPNSYSPYFSGTTWKDISSNGNNGLLVNGPIFNNVGKLSSFSFDGVDDYVDTSDVPFRITGYNFSVEFVFYYNNSTYNSIPLLAKRNPNNPFNQWGFGISNGNPYTPASGKVLMGFLRDDNNPNSMTFDRILTYTLPSAGIYHVILKTDQTNSQLWVNGVLRSTSSVVLNSGNFTINGYNLRIANNYTASYWDDKFYLVRFYRKSLSSSEILQNYNAELYSLYDTDAINFITAAGIDDGRQTVINQLVVDLKNYGLWTKMRAIYPFVGGTATAHKFNLKDPRDLNAAFRLSFVGTWVHNASGSTSNGTGYANTFINVNNNLNSTSHAINFYMNTDNDSTLRGNCGAYGNSSNVLDSYITTSSILFRSGDGAPTSISISNNGKGFFGWSRNSSVNFYIINQNGTFTTSTNTPTYSSINLNFYIGNINNIGGLSNSIQSFAFFSIGEGLTQDEMTNLRTIVQNFNTTLGRQV